MKSSRHRSSLVSRRGRSTAHLNTTSLTRRLHVETLEDRRMLSLNVDTLLDSVADDGVTSLREAIDTATSGDVIHFSVAGTIELQQSFGQLVIDKNLIIDGNNQITLDAGGGGDAVGNGNGFRIFNIDDGNAGNINVTLSGLTLTGGDVSGTGGAIRNTENLTLQQSTITGNAATGRGGGLYNNAFGNLQVDLSRFLGNTTTNDGGGIFNLGEAYIQRSTFTGNSAVDGGGLVARGTGATTVTASTFYDNTASDDGGGLANNQGTLNIFSSTISGNTATNNGGGVYSGTDSSTTIQYSTISDNGAITGGGVQNNGSIVTLSSTIIANSTSGADLNGLFGGSNNLVEDGTGGLSGAVSGGNIFNVDPELGPLADNGGPTQTHALLSGSPAIDQGASFQSNDQRGAPFTRQAGPFDDIGAYERQTVTSTPPFPNLVVDTTADENNGDYSAGDLSLREAIGLANGSIGPDTITFSPLFNTAQTINLNSQLPIITDDLTITGPGQTLLTLDAGNGDDGVFGTGDGFRIFEIDDDNDNEIDVTLSGLTLTGGDIQANSTADPAGRGGAIRNSENLTLTDSTIIGNATTFNTGRSEGGGGIYHRHGDLLITDTSLSGNRSDSGGGIVISSGSATITSSTISGNQASGDGGGISNFGTATITSSTISGNQASTGGGISNEGGATITCISSTISGNQASITGGGISNLGTATITSSTISANEAGIGAGIRNSGPTTITGSIVAGNTALFNANVFGSLGSDSEFNLIDVDPLLGPLADNGGPTQTHALLPGSPALDAGDPSVQPDANEFDQRGASFVRVAQGLVSGVFQPRIDIGAYEAQGPPLADFDSDLDVDGADFLAWQRGFGTPNAQRADGNSDDDMDTDASDLAAWEVSYGDTLVVPPLVGEGESAGLGDGANAELIDAAIALELFGIKGDPAAMRLGATQTPAVLVEAVGVPPGPVEVERLEVDGNAPAEDSDESSVEPWLAEELLERVFG